MVKRPSQPKSVVTEAGGIELFLATQTVNQPRYWSGFVQWAVGFPLGVWRHLIGWATPASRTFENQLTSYACAVLPTIITNLPCCAVDRVFFRKFGETPKSIYREHQVGYFLPSILGLWLAEPLTLLVQSSQWRLLTSFYIFVIIFLVSFVCWFIKYDLKSYGKHYRVISLLKMAVLSQMVLVRS